MLRHPKSLLALALGGALLVGGCATAPRAELTRLQAVMTTTRAAADPIFDDLAIAERRVGMAQATSAARAGIPNAACEARWIGSPSAGFIGALCPDHIRFESAIGDPPGTAALRSGLATLSGATEALLALAENRNLAEAEMQVQALTGALSALVQATAAPFGPTSGAADVLKLLGPVATQLQPLIDGLVAANNAERARGLILEYDPAFTQLIAALRGAVPAMFQIFVVDQGFREALAPPSQRAAIRADAPRLMNGYRRLLADYAVMLDGVARAWAATVVAARTPGSTDLVAINAALTDARVAAESVRRAQAAFRAGS
jgi:hypothetical protein